MLPDHRSAQASERPSDLKVYLRLLAFVKALWPFAVCCFLGFLVYSATVVLIADIMQFLLDSLGDQPEQKIGGGLISGFLVQVTDLNLLELSERSALLIPVLIIVLVILRGLGFVAGTFSMQYVAQHLNHQLRSQLFLKLTALPSAYLDQVSSGSLISRIVFNTGQISGVVTNAFQVVLREGMTLMFLLAYLFYMSWPLTIIFICTAPVIYGIAKLMSRRMRSYSERIQSSMMRITTLSNEVINAFHEVRIFAGAQHEQRRFSSASHDCYRQNIKLELVSAIGQPLIQIIVGIALSVLVWALLSPGLLGRFTPGQMMAYLIAAGLLGKPIKQISSILSVIQKGLAATVDIFTHLDFDDERDQGRQPLARAKGDFELRDVSFSYRGQGRKNILVLRDVNLSVQAGQRVALVGKSGAGKTTLTRLLARFYDLQQGQIILDGAPIEDYRLSDYRRQFALVSQSVALFNDTVYNNIAYGELSSAPREEVVAAAEAACALEFIEALPQRWETPIGEDGTLLSGGQRQRIAIARALLKAAPIVILDEATAALDVSTERQIQQAMETLSTGRTLFVVAHRLNTIVNADVIVMMEDGRALEIGTHHELLEREGAYATLYRQGFK